MQAATRRWVKLGAAGCLTLVLGIALNARYSIADRAQPTFHDLRVNLPEEYSRLVDPDAPPVQELAHRLGTLEAAYGFVRDSIAFEPRASASAPARTLADGRASCLGKAALLASLYRALGVPASDVRVVVGLVGYEGNLIEHAWVDLEYRALCLQHDATDLYGVHDFLRFPGDAYAREFAQREFYCFNDAGFAVVSQLNRMRSRRP
jgi:hypothetical protein